MKNSLQFKNLINYRLLLLLPFIAYFFLPQQLQSQPAMDTLASYWDIVPSPSYQEVRVLAADSNRYVYAGIWGAGIQRTTNSGVNWTDITYNLTNKYVTSITFDSLRRVYIGTLGGGVYILAINGTSWTQINTGLTNLRVKALKASGNGILYAGTIGGGIYLSTNGGQNWVQSNQGLKFWNISCLQLTPGGGVLAGTPGDGIYRSSDKGASWNRANGSVTSKNITCFDVDKSGEIICGTLGGGVNTSINDGASWVNFALNDTTKNVTCCVYYTTTTPVAGLIEYGIVRYDDKYYDNFVSTDHWYSSVNAMIKLWNGDIWAALPYSGIYKSTDGGAHWKTNVGFYQSNDYNFLLLGGKNGFVVAQNPSGGVMCSIDNGMHWNLFGLNGSVTSMCLDSTSNPLVAIGSSIYSTTDQGTSWNTLTANIGDPIVSPATAPSGKIFVATFYKPTGMNDPIPPRTRIYVSTNAGSSWTQKFTCDGLTAQSLKINYNGDLYMIENNLYSSYKTGLLKSTDGGVTWVNIMDPTLATPYSISFTKNGHVFVGTDSRGILRSTNNGTSWQSTGIGDNNAKVFVSKTNKLYAILTISYGLKYSTDEGDSWMDLNQGLTYAKPCDITINGDGFMFFAGSVVFRGIEPDYLSPLTLISPANAAEGIPLFTQFQWNSYYKADLYEYQIASDGVFNNVIEKFVIGDTIWNTHNQMKPNYWYYWRVRSRTNNALSDWSSVRWFVTIIDTVHLISPKNNSGAVDINKPVLTWFPVDGAGGYIIQISTDPDFKTFLVNKSVADTFYVAPKLTLYTKYFWRVQGKTTKSTGPWSEVWNFTTKLNTVTLKSPADKSYGLLSVTLLEWNQVSGGTKYDVQIAKDSLFLQMVFDGGTETNDHHHTKVLELFTTYYWRIRAYDDFGGNSDWSQYWSFTTVIDAAVLISPADTTSDTKLSVLFEWKKFDKATFYEIQVAKDLNFSQIVAKKDSVIDTKTDISSGLDFLTSYFWRVRNKVNQYAGLWSNVWQFTTGIGKVILVSPANNITGTSLDVMFTWKKVNGAGKYQFQLAKDTAFTNIVKQTEVNALNYSYSGLDYATTYYFRVKAIYSNGEGDWSDIWGFTTHDNTLVDDLQFDGSYISKLYPNPLNSILNIDYSLDRQQIISIEIYDLNGKLAAKIFNGLRDAGMNTISFNINSLTSGNYSLRIITENKILNKEFVIVR